MGQRGPKPGLPTREARAHSYTDSVLSVSDDTKLYPPFEMTEQELSEWAKVCHILQCRGQFTAADSRMAARYACALVEYNERRQYILKHGLYREMKAATGNSYLVKHPEVARIEHLEPLLIRFEQQLGMSPSSRSSLPDKAQSSRDDISDFLYGGRDLPE
jgi:P27 family predicted phage terminase small subunit